MVLAQLPSMASSYSRPLLFFIERPLETRSDIQIVPTSSSAVNQEKRPHIRN